MSVSFLNVDCSSHSFVSRGVRRVWGLNFAWKQIRSADGHDFGCEISASEGSSKTLIVKKTGVGFSKNKTCFSSFLRVKEAPHGYRSAVCENRRAALPGCSVLQRGCLSAARLSHSGNKNKWKYVRGKNKVCRSSFLH